MDRLTGRNDNSNTAYYRKCFEDPCFGMQAEGPEQCEGCEHNYAACDRLAAYEDTGLTPKEIKDLNNFEKTQCYKLLAEIAALRAENAALRVENKQYKIADKNRIPITGCDGCIHNDGTWQFPCCECARNDMSEFQDIYTRAALEKGDEHE